MSLPKGVKDLSNNYVFRQCSALSTKEAFVKQLLIVTVLSIEIRPQKATNFVWLGGRSEHFINPMYRNSSLLLAFQKLVQLASHVCQSYFMTSSYCPVFTNSSLTILSGDSMICTTISDDSYV